MVNEPLPYADFRTGLTFKAVLHGLKAEARHVMEREGRRMFITRHTVLGRWHQIKKESYAGYLRSLVEEEWESRADSTRDVERRAAV